MSLQRYDDDIHQVGCFSHCYCFSGSFICGGSGRPSEPVRTDDLFVFICKGQVTQFVFDVEGTFFTFLDQCPRGLAAIHFLFSFVVCDMCVLCDVCCAGDIHIL